MSAQAEDLDLKNSTAERNVKSLKEQIEELQDKLSEETRAKIAASNKMKQLDDEVERLNGQLEDEEEAKTALQNKLVQINQQVRLTCNMMLDQDSAPTYLALVTVLTFSALDPPQLLNWVMGDVSFLGVSRVHSLIFTIVLPV